MPRILHTADLHINAQRRYRKYYLKRMAHTLEQISRVAAAERVDYIVVSGDFYERRDILHEERVVLSEWMRQVPAPIIGISGNHDKRTQDIGDTSIAYLRGTDSTRVRGRHLVWDSTPRVVTVPNCTFILLPYEKWTDNEFYLVLDALVPQAKRAAKKNPIVVLMHEAITGATVDSGHEVPAQIHLDKKLLKRFRAVTYWALGDIHKCQSIAPNAWYSGAPHQVKFDEAPGKGVLIVDTDDPTQPTFVELDTWPLVAVNDSPEDFSTDPNALYWFRPGHAVPYNVRIPDNAILESTVSRETVTEALEGNRIGLLDGLDVALQRAGLKKDLVPLGVKLARKAAKSLNIKLAPERK